MFSEIAEFITTNKVASITCVNEDSEPYSFNCFYSFDSKRQLLFFKSSSDSHHAKLLLKNLKVSGTILPLHLTMPALKGIQFCGTVLYDSFPDKISPEAIYYKTYPFALAKRGQVYCVQLEKVKMTDNTRIFGKKLEWLKQPC